MSSRMLELWKHPWPLWWSRRDGNVASSLCTYLLPTQRLLPGRWCALLSVSHRLVEQLAKSSTSKWNTARKGVARHDSSQRVMVPWRHFQAVRPSVSRRRGQSPRYRETHGTGGRTCSTVGMLGSWCKLKRAPPAKGDQPKNWRATDPSTSGHQPHNWAGRRYFLTWSVSSSSVYFSAYNVSEVCGSTSTMTCPRSLLCARRRGVG